MELKDVMELKDESLKIVDHFLKCNGYIDPRNFRNTRVSTYGNKNADNVYLKLPYLSEKVSHDSLFRFTRNIPPYASINT